MPDDIIPLPNFLDPLLEFLRQRLSPEVYSVLITFLSHAIALVSGLVSLISSLIASRPWEWDAQDIIPPLITVLAAYLAILSLYRTTSWVVRTGFWLFKWGSILSILAGGAGWFLGNGGAQDIARNGFIPTVGNMLLDLFNGQGQNAAGQSRSRRPNSRSQYQQRKPKAWDSYDQHRQWRQTGQENGQTDAQQVIGGILNAAGKIAKDSGWLDLAKGLFGATTQQEDKTTGRTGKQKKKESTSRTRSR